MVTIAAVLVAVCAGVLLLERGRSGSHPLSFASGLALLYIVFLLIWVVLIMLGIVRIDRVMQSVGIYSVDSPWVTAAFYVPPLLFALIAASILRQRAAFRGGAERNPQEFATKSRKQERH
jgi:hypothetical protein